MTRATKNLSVMRTDESDRALKTLKETGMSQSEAIRWALRIAANCLEYAWLNGHEERGVVPQMQVRYRAKEI